MKKKLRKLARNPDLFFYDYFAKRLGNSNPTPKENAPLRIYSSSELSKATPWELLAKNFRWRSGALTGFPDQSFLLRPEELRLFIESLFEICESKQSGLQIYTLGGAFHVQIKPMEKIRPRLINRVFQSLLRKPDFVVEFPGLITCNFALHVFLYQLEESGKYALRSKNGFIKKIPIDHFEMIYPVVKLDARGVPKFKGHFPIDAVYTWVNHNDPIWQELWNKTFSNRGFDPDRFVSRDELKYSLRSLEKYAPWIRNVYVVSNCQRPEYLPNSDRLIWIDHKEIFPDSSVLPTFNSHAIEACLHRIQGLAEHFIYFNDDVFLNQPCSSLDFFDDIGRSIAYLEPYGMVEDFGLGHRMPDYLIAAQNCRSLLKKVQPNYRATRLHRHVPHALRRSTLEKIEELFPKEFATTRSAKIRTEGDINVTSFLYHHYAIMQGEAIERNAQSLIVRPNNIRIVDKKSDSIRFKFLCFNDGNNSSLDPLYKSRFNNFCLANHAYPCSFELDSEMVRQSKVPQKESDTFLREIEEIYLAASNAKEDEKRMFLERAMATLKKIDEYLDGEELHHIKFSQWKFKFLNLLHRRDKAIALLARLALVKPELMNTSIFYKALQFERLSDYDAAYGTALQLFGKEKKVEWVSHVRVKKLINRLQMRQIARNVICCFIDGRISSSASYLSHYHLNSNIHYSLSLSIELLTKLRDFSEVVRDREMDNGRIKKSNILLSQLDDKNTGEGIVFSCGLGYSGSGAVSDYLRSFSNVEEPDYPFDELIFLGGRFGVGSIYSILRMCDKSRLGDFYREVANFVFTAFLGLPVTIDGRNKVRYLKKSTDFVADRSILSSISTRSESTECASDLLHEVNQWLSQLISVFSSSAIKSEEIHSIIGNFCLSIFRRMGWRKDRVFLINNGLTADRLRVSSIFPGAKFIITTRDPRDQYVSRVVEASVIDRSVDANARLFRKRYNMLARSLTFHLPPNGFALIRFEEFVSDENYRRSLLNFCGLDLGTFDETKARFNPEKSKKNIGIHENWPDQYEVKSVFQDLIGKVNSLSKYSFRPTTFEN